MDDDRDIITAALKQFVAHSARYTLSTRYYGGDHRLLFATEKFRTTFGDLFQVFADNLCASVVDAVADRLIVTGFGVDSDEVSDAEKDALAQDAWGIWNANRMDRRQGAIHLEAARAGDAYVIVWPAKDGTPRLHPQRADEVTVRYDPEEPGVLLWAVKVWRQDDQRVRLNVYRPDGIAKYITTGAVEAGALPEKAAAFAEHRTEGEVWPLPNVWGVVPVFPFPNNANVGEWGRSELRDVIPLQDALNKSLADMLVAMEYVALPQRWVTGWTPPIDPETKKPLSLKLAVERVWAFGGKDVSAGQFPGTDLQQFIATQNSLRQEIAAVSRTPVHYLLPSASSFPSGEALKTAEAPLLAKVADRQVAHGNGWEDVMTLALCMARNTPDAALPQLSTRWKDTTPRNDADRPAQVQALTGAGANFRGAAVTVGYTEEEADAMYATTARSAAQ